MTEENVIRLGAKGLVISGSMYIALGTIYTMRGALNGIGGCGVLHAEWCS